MTQRVLPARSRCSWPTTTSSSAKGVKALIERHKDLRIVGVAADYDEVVDGATELQPQVLVTDIRMPPDVQPRGY